MSFTSQIEAGVGEHTNFDALLLSPSDDTIS